MPHPIIWDSAPKTEYPSIQNFALQKKPKGLACKLIPKYIGPYKIVKDFGNRSFKIELPASLRQRGIHDVFHSSLLRVHHPNDDRLFPGHLDSQIGQEYNMETEWTVDKILSHSGLGEDSTFEIKWKAGDVTWLPYNHVDHLQALSDYLDLLGVDNISLLPTASVNCGKPVL